MSDSSSLSEVEESPSSDSLDTLIGLSTETGRTTAVTPSSSSEDQAASSDPTLASSDSSRPITPRQEGNGQVQNGDPSRVPLAAPSSGDHAEHAAAAAASWPAAAHNTARPSLQAGDPNRAAPRPPRAPDICRQCETEKEHICFHSAVQSDRSDGSVGSQRHAEPPDPTGAALPAPRISPAAISCWAIGGGQ